MPNRQPSAPLPAAPHRVMLAEEHDRLIGVGDAAGNLDVARAGERRIRAQHGRPRPLDETRPHASDEDERRVLEVLHLQELPDHHRFEDGPDASRRHHERIGREHELMQASEERAVLECVRDKGVGVLLEGQVDADADRLRPSSHGGRSFIGRLHQSRSAAGDDVAPHLGQRRGRATGFEIRERSGAGPRRAEDRDAVTIAARRLEPRQLVDHIPQTQDRVHEHALDCLFVAQTDRRRTSTWRFVRGVSGTHRSCPLSWQRCLCSAGCAYVWRSSIPRWSGSPMRTRRCRAG